MTTITINVTQEDIDRSVPSSCAECPIAHAASRKMRGPVTFGGTRLLWCNKERQLCGVEAPREAIEFALRFDRGYPVAPFSFTIQVDDTWQEASTL